MKHDDIDMTHPVGARRPVLEVLTQPMLERIVAEAMDILWKVGVFVENEEALAVLAGGDARACLRTWSGARCGRRPRLLRFGPPPGSLQCDLKS
jgi:hypothetical protein